MGANTIVIRVRGLKECLARFKELPNKYVKAALRKGMRAGQKILTAASKANAPVATGRLQANIKTRAGKRSRKGVVMATVLGEGFYQGKTFYGAFQEFGWHAGKRTAAMQRAQRHGLSGAGGRKHIEGKHFMEKAAKQVGPIAGTIMVERTRYELEAALKSVGPSHG